MRTTPSIDSNLCTDERVAYHTVWVADDGLPIRWEAASIGTVSEISCGSSSALSVSMLFFMHGHDTCVPPSDTTGYGTATNTDLSTASFDVTVDGCAVGYVGTPEVVPCGGGPREYTLHGCTLVPAIDCSGAPAEYGDCVTGCTRVDDVDCSGAPTGDAGDTCPCDASGRCCTYDAESGTCGSNVAAACVCALLEVDGHCYPFEGRCRTVTDEAQCTAASLGDQAQCSWSAGQCEEV